MAGRVGTGEVTMNNTTISIIIAVVGAAISVLTFFIGRVSSGEARGRELGDMKRNMEHLQKSVDGVSTKLDALRAENQKSAERLARLEEHVRLLEDRSA